MSNLNFFQLFGLTQTFDIDLKVLESNYRKIQSESHPDRFVTASNADKIHTMQTATLANEAYLTLKSAGRRGAYLLGLSGIVAVSEHDNKMPHDFLMQQMQWRELVEDADHAKDVATLENLLNEIGVEAKKLQSALSNQFQNNDLTAATDSTRKLIFMDKVRADINKVIERLE